jgi:hypothetical protein
MDIVTGNDGQGAMLFLTASMEEGSAMASEEERNMEGDSKAGTTSDSADSSSKEDVIEVSRLTARMEKVNRKPSAWLGGGGKRGQFLLRR